MIVKYNALNTIEKKIIKYLIEWSINNKQSNPFGVHKEKIHKKIRNRDFNKRNVTYSTLERLRKNGILTFSGEDCYKLVYEHWCDFRKDKELMDEISKKRQERSIFLKTLYELAGGSSGNVLIEDHLKKLGLDRELYDRIQEFLINDGLVQIPFMRNISLTNKGIKRIEGNDESDAQSKTTYNFQNTYNAPVGNTAQGSQNVTQSATIKNIDNDIFGKLLEALKNCNEEPAIVSELTATIKEMRDNQGNDTFSKHYKQFMSIFSDHIQVFGPIVAPYLPALSQIAIG